MASQFGSSLRHDIEVMSCLARRPAERLSSCDPQITLVNVPQTREAPDCLGHVGWRDDNIEVDGWLGSQTRDGGAPDVLNPKDDVAQRCLHSRSEGGEATWPGRVILADQQ